MRWQGESGRKATGGRLILSRGKRKFETGREQSDTTIGAVRAKKVESYGGNMKMKMLKGDVASIADPKTGQTKIAKIETVIDNKANLHFRRRSIITKGAIIKTDLGEAMVTNRPGQHGVINAVLLPTQP
ncbi:MAG: 30S ribosomal protein S8e [Methanotrichaceae archaeon]|jgi:small subunit ribosomal protein S8e|nr:30S ribosomal protein S8e [Methanotrichaceae archaeon]